MTAFTQTRDANTPHSIFGSCFYVLDFKGIKGLTRVTNGPVFATSNPSDESNLVEGNRESNNSDSSLPSHNSLFDEAESNLSKGDHEGNNSDSSSSESSDSLFDEAEASVTNFTMMTAAQKSFDRLWVFFPFLDKDYMLNKEHGEVFFDLGIGFHPVDQDVAGVWRLEHMEASFGGAGYKRGTAHPLNTMWEVGGLMAEMRKQNREASHVVYQVAYSTAYEPLRKKDNEVNIFAAPDVVGCSQKFSNDYRTVQKILDGVQNSRHSYGVRREFRIGGDALHSVFACLDAQVSISLQCQLRMSLLVTSIRPVK